MNFQGKIVDEFGDPLMDAHISFSDLPKFNGVPYGTITDAKGDFSVNSSLILGTSKVTISYVGKETINDVVSNINFKTIVLKDDFTNLPGYTGTYKKKPCWLCIIAVGLGFAYSVNENNKK